MTFRTIRAVLRYRTLVTIIGTTLAVLVFAGLAVTKASGPADRATPNGGSGTRLLRSPTVSANQIAFAYANNIWTVDRAGGSSRSALSTPGMSMCMWCRRRAASQNA